MYGLLLQNMAEYIQNKHGDNMWKKVKEQLNLELDAFPAGDTFPESQIGKMGKTAMKILSMKDEEFYEGMGRYFVTLAKDAGYERTILQLGRRIRDFFLNLDNLHDYLKYTFPKMKAPSFFIETEDATSLMMQYRTRRRGFHYYVQGQVKEIAKCLFINTGQLDNKLDAKLKKQEIVFDTAVFHFELTYDNKGFVEYQKALESRKESSMPVRAGVFFEMFPFCLLFEKEMIIKNMGAALRFCIPQMIGKKVGEFWELIKPLVDFKYEVIETRMNSMFELATQDEIDKLRTGDGSKSGEESSESLELDDLEDIDKTLHIKGQMIFIKEWQQMLFLACPIMKGLNNLIWSGLFINDLSMHDYSRDIMLANAQTEMEANLAKMELAKKANITKQNTEKASNLKRENENLGFMFIPSSVIGEMAGGKEPGEIHSKVERSVILMAEVLGAEDFCSKAKKAVDVANFFNNVESIWDGLIKKNKCYKLDSITEFAVEAGGAEKSATVENIAALALDIKEATKKAVRDPAAKKPVKFAIAIAAGPVLTGVPGTKIPKFNCFGTPAIHARILLEACPDDTIILDNTSKGLLPGMFKMKDFKEVPGVGAAHKLEDQEGRKPLSDKDIQTKEPIEEAPKEDAKADAKAEGGEAPAAGGGGGDGGGDGGGGDGGGDGGDGEGGGGGDDGEAAATQEDGGDGSNAARPVSVANQQQCCGALKSGVCNLI